MAQPATPPAYPRLLLCVPEVADRLGISRTEVYRLVRRGALPSVHIGRSRRIVVADLEEFEKKGPEQIRAAAAPILVRHEPMDAVQREAADLLGGHFMAGSRDVHSTIRGLIAGPRAGYHSPRSSRSTLCTAQNRGFDVRKRGGGGI